MTSPAPHSPIIPKGLHTEDPLHTVSMPPLPPLERPLLRRGPNRRIVREHIPRGVLVKTTDDKMSVRELVASLSRGTAPTARHKNRPPIGPDTFTLPTREPALPSYESVRPIPLREVNLPMDLLRQLDDGGDIGSPLNRHFHHHLFSDTSSNTTSHNSNTLSKASSASQSNPFDDGNPFEDKTESANQPAPKPASLKTRGRNRRRVTRLAASLGLGPKPPKRAPDESVWFSGKGGNKASGNKYHGTI